VSDQKDRTTMHILRLVISIVLVFFGGLEAIFAQNAEHGQRLAERWCTECHVIDPASGKFRRAPPFASIAAKQTINADMITSFLLLPHSTMPNPPLSREDAQDIALFIAKMKK
jgi:mono/diheme cytochrome c family protein